MIEPGCAARGCSVGYDTTRISHPNVSLQLEFCHTHSNEFSAAWERVDEQESSSPGSRFSVDLTVEEIEILVSYALKVALRRLIAAEKISVREVRLGGDS